MKKTISRLLTIVLCLSLCISVGANSDISNIPTTSETEAFQEGTPDADTGGIDDTQQQDDANAGTYEVGIARNSGEFDKVELAPSSYPAVNMAISTKNMWSNGGTSFFIPASESDDGTVTITAMAEKVAVICFLVSDNYVYGEAAVYAEGTGRTVIPAGTTQTFSIPVDCTHINVLASWSNEGSYTPEKIEVTKNAVQKLKDEINWLKKAVEAIRDLFVKTGIIKKAELLPHTYSAVNSAVSTRNIWNSSGQSFFIPVSEILDGKITITANADNVAVVCFLQTDSYAIGETAAYAEGTGRTVIPAGTTQEFNIPSDCTHINILTVWDGNFTPAKIEAQRSTVSVLQESVGAMKGQDGDVIGLTVDSWLSDSCISSTRYISGVLKQGEVMGASSGQLKASGFVEVYNEMLEIPVPVTVETTYGNYGYSLYDADYNPIPGRCGSVIPNRSDDNYVAWLKIYLPPEAKYFRTTYWSDNSIPITEGKAPEFTYNLIKIPDEYKPITHELPVDTYMQNAIRRARQLTDIKWTPRVDIPRYSMMNGSTVHFLDWFYADQEYVGIPYSGAGGGEHSDAYGGWSALRAWGYSHNWVGQHIPFEAFVTAARYPNSIFSETVNQTKPAFNSSPFGIVCTALVNYAVDGPTPLRGITGFFKTADKAYRTSGATIADTDVNDIFIGDFLYTKTHVIIITDIKRDADGNVTHIEMSEATTVGNGNNSILGTQFGGVCRRKMWDVQEFKSKYGEYVKYRRATFYGISYVPSDYVDTGNEGDRQKIVDLPCIPYLGNTAVYRVGYIQNTKICIGATGFTSLVVTKDGEPFGTFDVTGLTEIDVGFSEIGQYEAYLSNGSEKTMSCKWSVVE